MRAALLVFGLLALSGCADPVADAKRELEIIERTGDKAAICKAKQNVADALLEAHNADDYELAKALADNACRLAKWPY